MNFERQISPKIIQLSPQGTSFTVEECNVATYLNTNHVISSAGQFLLILVYGTAEVNTKLTLLRARAHRRTLGYPAAVNIWTY